MTESINTITRMINIIFKTLLEIFVMAQRIITRIIIERIFIERTERRFPPGIFLITHPEIPETLSPVSAATWDGLIVMLSLRTEEMFISLFLLIWNCF